MTKLTKTSVDDLKSSDRDRIVWDSELKGFGVRVKPTGVKTYLVQYRNADGLSRRMVIGKHGVLLPEKARKLALIQLGAAASGEDPAGEKKRLRAGKTVSEVCDWYLEEARAGRLLGRSRKRLKPTTLRGDAARIEQHVKPLLGGRALRTLRLGDIERMQAQIASGSTRAARRRAGRGASVEGGDGVAARTVATLRAILGHAKRWGLIDQNPALGVRMIAYGKKTRRLSEAEIAALGGAMREAQRHGESTVALAAVTLMLMTGFRRGEALGLQYAWLGPQCVHFPDTKTGAQTRVIGKAARALIDSQRRLETLGPSRSHFAGKISCSPHPHRSIKSSPPQGGTRVSPSSLVCPSGRCRGAAIKLRSRRSARLSAAPGSPRSGTPSRPATCDA